MISLIVAILLVLLAIYFNEGIRKYSQLLYIGMTLLSILAFWQIEATLFTPIRLGGLGFGIFYVVMLTGALKHKSKLRITLMKVRMEYSILGFIAITPHALYQLLKYINGDIAIPILGIIAYAIMIPLFITSFRVIRKKMTYQNWKTLQRFAYIVYIGLSIHLILNSALPNFAVYIIEFAGYFILKVMYEVKRYQRTKSKQFA
ncbi:MAG: hypothetical protein K9L26_05065 [Candidatus Izimaplasma sp.]|nr:hypothetical protein [Candidatus Izimaplasma bacterium]